jgi:hypothetical protein
MIPVVAVMLIQAFNGAARKSREKRTISGEGPAVVVVRDC